MKQECQICPAGRREGTGIPAVRGDITTAMTGPDREETLTVLFVDGERGRREAVKLYASVQQELNVTVAATGAEAIRRLRQGLCPDTLVADVILPDMTAYELLSELGRLCLKQPPAVLLTLNISDDATCAKLLTAGADFLMLKPYRLAALFDTAAMVAGTAQTVVQKRVVSHVNWYLEQLKAPPDADGTAYLRRILCHQVRQDPISTADELYRELAEEERTTPNSISKSVGRAVRVIWQHRTPQYQRLCALYGEGLEKPLSNKKLIKGLAERIRWELNL